jgi:uncharacterized sporulation protein YeaH/YhbH (DUF444 family)
MSNSNPDKGRRRTKRPKQTEAPVSATPLTAAEAGMTPADVSFVVQQLNEQSFGAQFRAEILPEPAYLDRTKPDRDRFMQRLRPQISKDHIKNLLRRGGDIFKSVQRNGVDYKQFAYPELFKGVHLATDAGRNFVPASDFALEIPAASLPIGIGEPRWRPGRDRPGSGGGGPDASDDPADLVYLPITMEELAELLALLFDLPWLLAKDQDKILAYTLKIRGVKKRGPMSRLDLEATQMAWLERWRSVYNANPEEWSQFGEDDIPDKEDFPLDDVDLRFKRVEEKWDPDSKAVVFFEEDSSGSMGGEPIAMARFYFLLNLVWLRARYGEVDVVLISHNAMAFRVETEQEFFAVDAGGGTVFSPAHVLAMEIADREYPADLWNRYAFHGTDGYNFEPPAYLAEVIERMVTEGQGNFNFFGYLEIDPYGWGGGFATGGMQAINLLSEAARSHVGAARVRTMDEIPEAMKQIVDRDPSANES